MPQLIKYTDFLNKKEKLMQENAYVITDKQSHPMGFAFGKDAFIQLLEKMDEYYQDMIPDQRKAYTNPAGRLIDQIEEYIPLKEHFIQDVADTAQQTDTQSWIPFKEIIKNIE